MNSLILYLYYNCKCHLDLINKKSHKRVYYVIVKKQNIYIDLRHPKFWSNASTSELIWERGCEGDAGGKEIIVYL